ncbi:hypothetical protein H4R34_000011 [Dimargaris verticillata]|uniref:Uncharacterized protein n=1 Tax=Dimargaris verticillata TaxID=2761393 RepID=A0A9W8BE35_9FUNG|nr:hypothetical protein H4R34_000011 [Dimargaris verticillata]
MMASTTFRTVLAGNAKRHSAVGLRATTWSSARPLPVSTFATSRLASSAASPIYWKQDSKHGDDSQNAMVDDVEMGAREWKYGKPLPGHLAQGPKKELESVLAHGQDSKGHPPRPKNKDANIHSRTQTNYSTPSPPQHRAFTTTTAVFSSSGPQQSWDDQAKHTADNVQAQSREAKEKAQSAVSQGAEWVEGTMQNAKDRANASTHDLKNRVNAGEQTVKDSVNAAAETVKDQASHAYGQVAESVDEITAKAQDVYETATDNFTPDIENLNHLDEATLRTLRRFPEKAREKTSEWVRKAEAAANDAYEVAKDNVVDPNGAAANPTNDSSDRSRYTVNKSTKADGKDKPFPESKFSNDVYDKRYIRLNESRRMAYGDSQSVIHQYPEPKANSKTSATLEPRAQGDRGKV